MKFLKVHKKLGLPVKVDEAYEALGFAKPESFKDDTVGGTPKVDDESDTSTD